jgi:hypothetical protein
MEDNPLDPVYASLIQAGYTPEQIEAFTIRKFVESGKGPAELAQLAAAVEQEQMQQVESNLPDITQPLSEQHMAAIWVFLNDGVADSDYAVPLAKALQALNNHNLADFARATASLFKSMRKRTPHLEGNNG